MKFPRRCAKHEAVAVLVRSRATAPTPTTQTTQVHSASARPQARPGPWSPPIYLHSRPLASQSRTPFSALKSYSDSISIPHLESSRKRHRGACCPLRTCLLAKRYSMNIKISGCIALTTLNRLSGPWLHLRGTEEMRLLSHSWGQCMTADIVH